MTHITFRRTPYAFVVLLALLALLASAAPAHSQQDGAASLEEYQRALHDAEAILVVSPADVNAARQRLAGIDKVLLRSGEEIPIEPLLGAADEAIRGEVARQRLEIAITQLAHAGDDQTAARLAILEKVLAGPAFQSGESLLDRLRRWLANLIDGWARRVNPGASPGPLGETTAQVVGWVVVAGATILLVFLLGRWLQALLHTFVGETVAANAGDGDQPTTSAAARQAANRFAQGGDYRSAVRNLYLAALLTLQERRIVPRDPSLTNREMLARTPEDHPLHAPLQSVVDVFDDVWYGVHEPDIATFEHYAATVDDLERGASTRDSEAKAAPR